MNFKPPYDSKVKKESKLFYFFSIMAVVSPIAAYTVPWIPYDGGSYDIWFQRSGSLMVAFALFAEASAVRFESLLGNDGPFGNISLDKERTKYFNISDKFHRTSFYLIAIGTIIWGYGDMIVKCIIRLSE